MRLMILSFLAFLAVTLAAVAVSRATTTSCQQLDALRAYQHLFTPDQVAQAKAWYAANCSQNGMSRKGPRRKLRLSR